MLEFNQLHQQNFNGLKFPKQKLFDFMLDFQVCKNRVQRKF